MPAVLFISEARLKKLTAVHENVEPDDLMPFVIEAQDIYIQQLLGTKFYNSLKDAVLNSTLTAAETTLLDDYIAPCLANYTVYQALPSLNYKIFNKSVQQPDSETATNTTFEQLRYMRDHVEKTAQFYRERAREFLIDNQTDYPDYINYGVDGMAPDKQNDYYSGLVIPKWKGCGYYENNPDVQEEE